MQKYIIPIQEKITMWQNANIIIETEDSIEEIYNSIQKGELISNYEIIDYSNVEYMTETEEHELYDYDNITKEDIEKIQ